MDPVTPRTSSTPTIRAAVSHEIDVSLPADALKLTSDMKKHAQVLKFGDTVTFTLQLINEKDEPVTEKGVVVDTYAVIHDSTGESDTDSNGLRRTTRTIESEEKTDASGRITIDFSAVDPDGDVKNRDEITLSLTLTAGVDAPGIEGDDANADAPGTQVVVMWADDDSVAKTLALEQATEYHVADVDGETNTVTATLGRPVR